MSSDLSDDVATDWYARVDVSEPPRALHEDPEFVESL